MSTPHIEAELGEIAKIVLMPGDPKRAEFIAKNYLTGARLINVLRSMNAYTGYYKGVEVTIFPSGMGMPSMGIYSHELYDFYDVDVIIRIGSAGSYNKDLKLFDIFLSNSAYSETNFDEESINKDLEIINASIEINNIIKETAKKLDIDIKEGRVHTSETFYTSNQSVKEEALKHGCDIVEMENYSLLVNAKKFHKKATGIFTITDELYSDNRMDAKSRELKLNTMITLALESVINLKK